jgi:hypothetical protein
MANASRTAPGRRRDRDVNAVAGGHVQGHCFAEEFFLEVERGIFAGIKQLDGFLREDTAVISR